MLDRLETAKFVRREPNPDDRRSVIVVLTDRGEAVLDEYRDHFREAIEKAVPVAMRRELADCVLKLSGALDTVSSNMEAARLDTARRGTD